MTRVFGAAAVAVLASVFLASAGASPPQALHVTHPLGVIPHLTSTGLHAKAAVAKPSNFAVDPNLQLVYHHGPVMHSQRIYAIFWIPSGYQFGSTAGDSTTYEATVEQYIQDVAHDSGTSSTPYGALSQYYSKAFSPSGDPGGPVNYDVSYGGAYVDTVDPISLTGGCNCVTDAQVEAEVGAAMSSEGWSGGLTNQFAVFLPSTVRTCFDAGGTQCSDSAFCAYHSAYGTVGTPIVYLNLPFEASAGSCHSNGVAPQPLPNGQADIAIGAMSHEIREAATDPIQIPNSTIGGWYDAAGNEADDKCYEDYGFNIGSNYNQLINGDPYDAQLEWSNAIKQCYQMGFPTITSITPTSGAAGDTIGVTGTNFYVEHNGGADAEFGKTGTSAVVIDSPTHLTVTVPSGNATGRVSVSNFIGQSISNFVVPPVLSPQTFSMRPTVDPLGDAHDVTGTKIQVNGTGFFGVRFVKIGGVAGAFSAVATNGGSLDVVVPAAAVSGNLTVTTAGGTSTDVAPFAVTPRIASFSPLKAPGFSNVTILGTGLAGATEVDFNGDASPQIVSDTATKIVAEVPDDATAGVITVKNGTDTVLSAKPFTPLPVIGSISPLDGDTSTTVTISGGELADATAVKFGTVLQPVFTAGATSITTLPPAGFSTGRITVVTPEGTTVSKQIFSITKVTSVTPVAAANAVITISGQGLSDAQTVDFNGAGAPQPVLGTPTATSVKVVVPGDALDGPLTVNTPNTAAVTPKPFKPLPKIVSFDQPSYQAGDTVTVTGTNLLVAGPVTAKIGAVSMSLVNVVDANHVTFDIPDTAVSGPVTFKDAAGTTTSSAKLQIRPTITGDPVPNESTVGSKIVLNGETFTGTTSVLFGADTHKAAAVVGAGGTTLTVTIPPTATSGKVSVTNAGGTTQTANDFTLDPVVTKFAPASGPTGTQITVTGTGFTNADDVTFTGGGTDGTPTNVSATSLKVVVPPGTLDGGIQVSTGTDGAFASSATSATSFHATLTAYTFTPKMADYGAQISIVGVGLTGVTEVDFNGVPGTSLNVSDDQDLTVDVPASGSVNGPVTLKNGGTTITAGGGDFTVTPLAVSSLSDSAGLVGSLVTITGTGFVGVSGVSFGGVAATYYHVDSDTQISAQVPTGAVTGVVEVSTSNGNASSSTFTVESDPTSSSLFLNEVAPVMNVTPYGFVELYSTSGAGSLDLNGVKLVYVPGTATQPSEEVNYAFQQGAVVNGSGFADLTGMQEMSGTGGVLVLVLPDGTTVSSVAWGTLTTFAASQGGNGTPAPAVPGPLQVSPFTNYSIALSPDGHTTGDDNTDYQVTSTPTPDAANTITP